MLTSKNLSWFSLDLGQLTFDPSVFNTGSHSEEYFGKFVVPGRAGQGEEAFSVLTGVLDVLTCVVCVCERVCHPVNFWWYQRVFYTEVPRYYVSL